jgi:hypothetical protein
VNRWGANGEQWQVTKIGYFCGNIGYEELDPVTATSSLHVDAEHRHRLRQGARRRPDDPAVQPSGDHQLHGRHSDRRPRRHAGLLPVDGDTFTPAGERAKASIPPPYEPTMSYPDEMGAPLHNFGFTSEVRYWFPFDATKTYRSTSWATTTSGCS